MKRNYVFLLSLALAGLASCGNGGGSAQQPNGGVDNGSGSSQQSSSIFGSNEPVMEKMLCEYVPDGQTAVIYGSNLKNCEIMFPGADFPAKIVESSNNQISVIVPEGAEDGQLKIKYEDKFILSKFFFRDNRNIIINFDYRLATWGGYNPFDETGELITGTLGMGTELTPFENGAKLPQPCSGNYGLLYGKYDHPWMMDQTKYIQYVANPLEGGRGPISVATKAFESYDLSSLALKFEVYVPKETPYKNIKTEIFFGPIDSPDKHGREVSPICFWEPYKDCKDGFYTDSWTTITIPLTEFWHGTKSDVEPFAGEFDLKKATNLSFLQFGQPEGEPLILMCVDNFRIVPIN